MLVAVVRQRRSICDCTMKFKVMRIVEKPANQFHSRLSTLLS